MSHYSCGFLYNPLKYSVLLHKRDHNTQYNPGKWALFGGLSEGSESPEATFIREMKEEISIEFDSEEITPLLSYINPRNDHMRHVYYVESILPKSAMKLGEGEGLDWVLLNNVFSLDLTLGAIHDLRYFIDIQDL